MRARNRPLWPVSRLLKAARWEAPPADGTCAPGRILFRALQIDALRWVDADTVTFFDEWWNLHQCTPVSSFAGFGLFDAVAPFNSGEVSTTLSSTDGGSSTPMAGRRRTPPESRPINQIVHRIAEDLRHRAAI